MIISRRTAVMLMVLAVTIASATSAIGEYRIDWHTIDGGGGKSTGGGYTLVGTIGQPDAAYSSSANYELLGGFWSGGPICVVAFDDFARFAESWLQTGAGLAGDIDMDNDVDVQDLSWLADFWLCYCPAPWPLK